MDGGAFVLLDEGFLDWRNYWATLTIAVRGEGGHVYIGKEGEKLPINKREREIVRLVVQGLANKEIGERLFIDEQKVNDQLQSIINKFGLSDRLELTLYALKNNITDDSYECSGNGLSRPHSDSPYL